MALIKYNNTIYFIDRVCCYKVVDGTFIAHFNFDSQLDRSPFPVILDSKIVLVTGNKFVVLDDLENKLYHIIEHNSNFDIVCDSVIIEDLVYLSCTDGIHVMRGSEIIKTNLDASGGFITFLGDKLYYYSLDPVYRSYQIKSCELGDDLMPAEATEVTVQKVDSYLNSCINFDDGSALMIAKSPFGCCFGSVNSSDCAVWKPGRHITNYKVSEIPHFINRCGFVENDLLICVREDCSNLKLQYIDISKYKNKF